METMKKLKLVYVILIISIISGMTAAGIFFAKFSVIYSILWYVFTICFIIFPMIAIYFMITEYRERNRKDLEKTAKEIDNLSERSGHRISEFEGFEKIGKSVDSLYSKKVNNEKLEKKLNQLLVLAATKLEINEFLNSAMDIVLDITQSHLIAVYIVDKVTGKLEIKSSRGFSSDIFTQFDIKVGEGAVGQVAARNEIKILRDLPDDTIYIAQTFLGKVKPKSIIAVPIQDEENEVIAVMALASFFNYDDKTAEVCKKIAVSISYAIKNGMDYERNQRNTSELKFQSQLMQNLNDDLEDKIKERTFFLNNIINSINDTAIITVDKDNYISVINKGAEKFFSISADDVYGKNINVIANGVKSTEKVLNENIYEALTNSRASHKGAITLKDGIRAEVSMELFCLYDEFGEKNAVTVVIRDMSEFNKIKNQAQNDKLLSDMLISESEVAVVVTDRTGVISNTNKNARYILNMNSNFKNTKNIADFFENKLTVKSFISDTVKNRVSGTFKASLVSGINVKIEVNVIYNDLGDDIRLLMYIH